MKFEFSQEELFPKDTQNFTKHKKSMDAMLRQFVKEDHCREMHEVLRAGLQMPKGILPRLQPENEIRKEVIKRKEKNGSKSEVFHNKTKVV